MRDFNCVWVHSGHDPKKQHFNENLLTVKLKLLVLSLEITGTLDYHHLQICEASVLKNVRGDISLEKHMPSGISLEKKKKKNACTSFFVEFSIFFSIAIKKYFLGCLFE